MIPVVRLLCGLLTAALSLALAPAVTLAQPRLAELDCGHVDAQGVRTLSAYAAPRVILLQGSVAFVTMAPFGDFLADMGYPAERLADPVTRERTRSSFVDARRLAGEIGWHYEQDGVMPVMIGHSQGGMVVIRVLHELAGTFGAPIPVWNPTRDAPEERDWVTGAGGEKRPVRSLRLDYATALATGSLPRVLLGQWGMLPLLRDVPDSVAHFTGFAIPWDPIAGTGAQPAGYHATGAASVRNVVLPSSTSHIRLPDARHLAAQPAVRAWIEAYVPGTTAPLPEGDVDNLLHAADIWYSLKRNWCETAQRGAAVSQPPR